MSIKDTTAFFLVRGKNLFNKKNVFKGYVTAVGNISDGITEIATHNEATSDFIEISSGKYYTFSARDYTTQTGESMWVAIALYDSNKNIINRYSTYETASITVNPTQTANAKYVRVSYRYNDNNIKCQFEQSETVTTYEPYINKEIWAKNGNGSFDNFYDESKTNQDTYSFGEQKIGTWANGKPLYRRIYQFNLPQCVTSGTPVVENHTINDASFAFIEFGYIFADFINAPMPYFTRQNPSQNIGYDLLSPNTLRIWNSFKDWNNAKILVSVLYTKTSD